MRILVKARLGVVSLIACAAVGFPSASFAQVGKLYPVDQAAEDPSFFLHRLRLAQAIAARDTTFLFAQLHPQIKTSFGGDAGLDDFKRMWDPALPESKLWSTLAELIVAGGSFGGSADFRYFQAPYWNSEWDGDQYDPFDYGVIVGDRVNARAAPSKQSPVLGLLSYDIVRVLDFYPPAKESDGTWVKIELTNEVPAYVSSDYVHSPIGYRVAFSKSEGKWLMQWFLAGD